MKHSKLPAEMWFLLVDLYDTAPAYYMIERHTGVDHGVIKIAMDKIRNAVGNEFLQRIKQDIEINGT